MIPTQLKVTKMVALILVLSLLQVYVQTSAAQTNDSTPDTASRPPQALGRLSTSGNRDILVDKIKAETGATILDGATLETTDCTTATVRIGPLDEIQLATNTIAVINYSAGKVQVTLKQGCVRLLTEQSVEGTIVTPDGKITAATQLDASNREHAEVCYPDGTRSDFISECFPLPIVIWLPGGIGSALAIVAVAAQLGEDPSPIALS